MRSILFQVGAIPIRSYGFMMTVGFMLSLWRAVKVSAKRKDISSDNVMDAAFFGLISGILGARILFILLDAQGRSINWWASMRIWEGGLSFHGGLIAAVVAVAIYTRRKGIPFLAMADVLAPSLAIGYAFTRIGCFLNGCCYGVETHLPWAVRFQDPVSGCLTLPCHPVQIYAMLANFAIFGILAVMEKRSRGLGYIFFSYLGLYSIYRFLAEFLRKGVTGNVLIAGLTQAQVLSVGVLILVILVIIVKYRDRVKPAEIVH